MLPCTFVRVSLFFYNDTPTTEIYTLSLHDALPISDQLTSGVGELIDGIGKIHAVDFCGVDQALHVLAQARSEEHTSELQSHHDLVCRLLLEKKKKKTSHLR